MRGVLRFVARNSRSTTIAIFCFALIVRLAVLWLDNDRLRTQQPGEAMRIAKSLIRNGEFAHAYGEGTGPTAHTTPLYPLLIASVLSVFGNDAPGYVALRLLTCGSAALVYAMLPKIAELYGFSKRAGLVGALLGAAVPYGRLETEGDFENILATSVFLGFLLLLNRITAKNRISLACFYGVGAMTGMIALLGMSFLPAMVFIIYDFLGTRARVLRISTSLALILGCVTVLSPWILRNYFVFKTFIPMRGNFWLEMAVSNQKDAKATLEQNIDTKVFHRIHPYSNKKERERYMKIGEINYMREKKRQALNWIRSNPAEFFRLSLSRLAAFFFYRSRHMALTVFMMSIVAFAICGTALSCWVSGNSVKVIRFLGVIMTFCIIHVGIQVGARYRYPAHVLMLIPTGALGELVWRRFKSERARF